jgi:hypothetical protein
VVVPTCVGGLYLGGGLSGQETRLVGIGSILIWILIPSSKESWNKKNSPKGADLNAPVSWGRRITDLASAIILSHLLRTAFALALHERAMA